MRIAVLDGMGGGIGAQLVSRLRAALPQETEIIALGANSSATERMLKSGATRGASGENAVRISVALADLIVAPLGVVIPNSMMGEITLAMAEAVMAARAEKLLIPVAQAHFTLVGVDSPPLARMIALAVEAVAAKFPRRGHGMNGTEAGMPDSDEGSTQGAKQ